MDGITKIAIASFFATMLCCLVLFFAIFCEELNMKQLEREILELQKQEEQTKLNYYKILEETYRRQLK